MTRFVSFILVSLLCSNIFSDDKYKSESETKEEEMYNHFKSQVKRLDLAFIKTQIINCDHTTKRLGLIRPLTTNTEIKLVMTFFKRTVMMCAYYECWIFSSTYLKDFYFDVIK